LKEAMAYLKLALRHLELEPATEERLSIVAQALYRRHALYVAQDRVYKDALRMEGKYIEPETLFEEVLK